MGQATDFDFSCVASFLSSPLPFVLFTQQINLCLYLNFYPSYTGLFSSLPLTSFNTLFNLSTNIFIVIGMECVPLISVVVTIITTLPLVSKVGLHFTGLDNWWMIILSFRLMIRDVLK